MRVCLLTLLAWVASAGPAVAQARLVIGSKNFTESHLLGELFEQLIEARTELEVEHRTGLGGTLVCFEALREGEIDVYPEYTGTGWAVLLEHTERITDPLETFARVQRETRADFGLEWLTPLGFDNTYAIAVRAETARRLNLARISDLALHAKDLRAGVSLEFLEREDGWPGLAEAYGLGDLDVRGMEHALAYEALERGEIDLIDAYATDGKLLRYELVVLSDDQRFFPPYQAAPLIRSETLERHPEVGRALDELSFAIDARAMAAMNLAVEVEGRSFASVATEFLGASGLLEESAAASKPSNPRVDRALAALPRRILEHVGLTALAVLLAALVAIPLGVIASRRAWLQRIVLGFAGVAQTVPSLALLAMLIAVPFFGLSMRSAVFALFLYALLPILRNTIAGLGAVDPELVEAARGIGLTARQTLTRVKIPLALGTILAGVRTAAVISVGVATLAAFIGAGGLGEPIITGLYLNDTRLILSGAIPAALLALLVDALLGWVERGLAPRV